MAATGNQSLGKFKLKLASGPGGGASLCAGGTVGITAPARTGLYAPGSAAADGDADGQRRRLRRGQKYRRGPRRRGPQRWPRSADCNSPLTADCNSPRLRTVIRSERITVRTFELAGWFWISVMSPPCCFACRPGPGELWYKARPHIPLGHWRAT